MASADSKDQRVTHGIPLNLSGEGLGCHILSGGVSHSYRFDGRWQREESRT